MSGYGFRLYTVKVVRGGGKSKAVPLDQVGRDQKQHIGTWVRRLLDELEDYDALTQMPARRHAEGETLRAISDHLGTGDRDDPRVDFHEHTKTPTSRIRFEFSYGRLGRVPFAIGDTPADFVDLRQHAAGHRYRGLFYFPKAGEVGVLALETIPSSAHPVESLNAWLARAALDVAFKDSDDILALPEAERAGLEAVPFKLNFSQVVNYGRLEKMIKETSDVELVLRKTSISKGATAESEKIRLVTKIDTLSERNRAVKVAHKLFDRISKEGDEAAGMVELEGLAPGDVSDLEFNDGYIKVDDGNNGVKKIGIDAMDRFFIYPVGSSVQLKALEWEKRVAAEVVSLQGLLGVELEVS